MVQTNSANTHPIKVLRYLEWIILGVALMVALNPGSSLHGFRLLHPEARPWRPLLGIISLGTLGFWLPLRTPLWQRIAYTGLGFWCCWLSVLFSGQRGNLAFAALMLIVVMRACLLFNWMGRSAVAIAAFSFSALRIGLWVLAFQRRGGRWSPFPDPLPGPVPGPPMEIQQAFLNLSIGSALFYGVILVFVVLLVGTLMGEHENRTKLAEANQRLRRYALLIENQATVQERNRIAREIHDSVGHALTAQSIHLENVALWLEKNQERANHHLNTARTLGKDALQNVRQSVAALQQPLQGNALPQALQDLLKTFADTTNLAVQSKIHLLPDLPKEAAIALYRITQEALTNIAKHAQATQVSVTLNHNDQQIGLIIHDDGQGFNPAQNSTGFGLQSMAERTEALGGQFKIQTQPGQGCRLEVVLPRTGAVP